MSDRHFQDLLEKNWAEKKFICVGLDSEAPKLPKGQSQLSFNQSIVEATHDLVAAYKPNTAFYESQGVDGFKALKQTIQFIHEKAPRATVILDAKRADIGNTSKEYALACFEELQADAVTLNPYLGFDALEPFLDYKDKGCFILCRTSNPGAKEFQDLLVDGEPLYIRIAGEVSQKWNRNKNCGLVVGATYPEELKKIRGIAPDLPFLVPGVGAQGGGLTSILKYGRDRQEKGLLINVSRGVIFASAASDFAKRAREEVLKLTEILWPTP